MTSAACLRRKAGSRRTLPLACPDGAGRSQQTSRVVGRAGEATGDGRQAIARWARLRSQEGIHSGEALAIVGIAYKHVLQESDAGCREARVCACGRLQSVKLLSGFSSPGSRAPGQPRDLALKLGVIAALCRHTNQFQLHGQIIWLRFENLFYQALRFHLALFVATSLNLLGKRVDCLQIFRVKRDCSAQVRDGFIVTTASAFQKPKQKIGLWSGQLAAFSNLSAARQTLAGAMRANPRLAPRQLTFGKLGDEGEVSSARVSSPVCMAASPT